MSAAGPFPSLTGSQAGWVSWARDVERPTDPRILTSLAWGGTGPASMSQHTPEGPGPDPRGTL